MNKTAVEWFYQRILANDIKAVYEKALEMEKEQIKQIREMLMQGALENMSCASAIVEFDKITKSE
tara:strand:- start:2582 stop:2776 length:195 start_codon:yes stop_codon:yes gene_type:complete